MNLIYKENIIHTMRKLTNQEFIESCRLQHGDKYDYSLINYTNSKESVEVICHIHGKFNIVAWNFKKGFGCRDCSIDKIKESQKSRNYIDSFKRIHGHKYNYDLVEYINNKTKVKIVCEKHGIFEQRPDCHISGDGCPDCGGNKKTTNGEFIKKSKIRHGGKYDYKLVTYKNNITKVDIICKKHGIFNQTPKVHLKTNGCPKCSKNKKLTKEDFVEKSRIFHKDRYDYSKVEIVNSHTPVIITCKKHGDFKQQPYKHMQKRGCPKCRNSKGIITICNLLQSKNIEYEMEKTLDGCVSKNNNLLYFDIHIPIMNIYIEYDGEQHFRPVKNWGGKKALNEIKDRDNRKNRFCIENNIDLFRISYLDNIDEKLNMIISSYHQ